MKVIELQWLRDESSLKEALQKTLGCSGQLIKKYFSTKEQDRAIKAGDISSLPLEFVNHLYINPEFCGPLPLVLKETDQYLALHKPANLHCHPLNYSDENTVLNFLVNQKKWQPLNINIGQYDRGLLYRLDFETSGILLLAKDQKAFDEVRNHFHERMKKKIYWAIVEGDFNQEGEWTHYFQSSGPKGSKQKVSLEAKASAQSGSLEVKKIAFQDGKSLIMVSLKTGLRHQIRAQLSALGFPLLGDELYGGHKAARLFLHAFRYESDEVFEDPHADLFDSCFDLDSALQVSHDVLRIL